MTPRILVTNDDGIDSAGLHHLARAIGPLGDVVVVAPDREFSGAGASIGALQHLRPTARRDDIDGVAEAWAISASPAMCAILGRFGLFGSIDLVVSGINPGVNAGRAVYHSGTVGAALTARNGGITGIAVSQHAAGYEFSGQVLDPSLEHLQLWETAATVAATVAAAVLADPPTTPAVINLNVPNLPLAEIAGWRHAGVSDIPLRALGSASMRPDADESGAHPIDIAWGYAAPPDDDSDEAAIPRHEIAVTYLSRLTAETRDDTAGVDRALTALF